MKIALAVLLFAATAMAQNPASSLTAACGPSSVSFNVKLDYSDRTEAPLEAGKARVYFIHDAGAPDEHVLPTIKLGVDGAWVGANHGDSYFSVSIEPGEHHLCLTLQTSLFTKNTELAHFTAEAGKTYYYRTRFIVSQEEELLELEQIDSDQGKYLIDKYPWSVFKPKK